MDCFLYVSWAVKVAPRTYSTTTNTFFLRKLPINQGIFLEKKEENGSGKKTLFGLSCTKVTAQCIINEPVRR